MNSLERRPREQDLLYPVADLSAMSNYQPQGEGNVFTGVCLFTIGLMATRSLLVLVRRGRYSSYWNAFFCSGRMSTDRSVQGLRQ